MLEDEGLTTESIEGAATRPPMFLGLPRKLSSILLCLAGMFWILISGVEDLVIAEIGLAMVFFSIKPLVARDYWGFDIVLVALGLNLRCLDVRTWGGARAAPFPVRRASPPYGMFGRA